MWVELSEKEYLYRNQSHPPPARNIDVVDSSSIFVIRKRSNAVASGGSELCCAGVSSPLLSIITINRNNASGLRKTIAGFREWRRLGVEFVFVDGMSTDSSLQVAHTFYREDEIRSEPDRGIYHAMNKGIMRASGNFLLFLNSGDHLLEGSSQVVLPVLSTSSADLVTFGTKIIWICRNHAAEEFNPGPPALPKYTLPHQSTFFRRGTVWQFDGYDETFKVAGDRDLILRLYQSGANISWHRQCIAIYYSGGISSSRETTFENIWIDIRQGRRSFIRLLIGWLRHPPGSAVQRFFSLAFRHLLANFWSRRRLNQVDRA